MHTTGTDIQHVLNANAVLTLGKDMTLRDYAQGAYRMRGIGKGQRIYLYIIPEVDELIRREVGKASAGSSQPLADIAAVMAWLVINSMRSERLQFNLLQMQNAANIWRKNAFQRLLDNGTMLTALDSDDTGLLQKALEIFQEDVEFTLNTNVPEGQDVYSAIMSRAQLSGAFIQSDADHVLLDKLLANVKSVTEEDINAKNFEEEVRSLLCIVC